MIFLYLGRRKEDNPTRRLGSGWRRLCGLSALIILLMVGLIGCGERQEPNVDIQEAVKQLDSRRAEVRVKAAFALGNVEQSPAKAVRVLQRALKDKSAKVRKAAALSLMEIGNQARSAAPALKEAYKKEQNRDVALTIASALRQVAPQTAKEMELPYY